MRIRARRAGGLRALLLGAAGGAFLAGTPGARAGDPVSYGFSGIVDVVVDPGGRFGDSISPGSPFQGRFTIDPDATDLDGRATFGLYLFTADPFLLRVEVGDQVLETQAGNPSLAIEIANDFPIQGKPADRFGVVSDQLGPLQISLQLLDLDAGALESDALPPSPPPLELFELRVFEVQELDPPTGATLQGTVTRLEVLPEPAPGAVAFALATGLGLRRVRRRWGRRSPRGSA